MKFIRSSWSNACPVKPKPSFCGSFKSNIKHQPSKTQWVSSITSYVVSKKPLHLNIAAT